MRRFKGDPEGKKRRFGPRVLINLQKLNDDMKITVWKDASWPTNKMLLCGAILLCRFAALTQAA